MGKLNIGQMLELAKSAGDLIEQLKELRKKAVSPKVQADYHAFTQLVDKLEKDAEVLKTKLGDGQINQEDALALVDVVDDIEKIVQGIGTLQSNFGTDLQSLAARFKIL